MLNSASIKKILLCVCAHMSVLLWLCVLGGCLLHQEDMLGVNFLS